MKERIAELMRMSKLTQGKFADMIGISAAQVSQMISGGRDNPGLDIIQKLSNAFPEISPDWLISGKMPMYRRETYSRQHSLFDFENEKHDVERVSSTPTPPKNVPKNPPKEIKEEPKPETPPILPVKESKTVKKIIVYYSDSTFEEFNK
ncbi:MAG: helix-turn-helix domain-containing protein [Paludibacter sp.]|jgi:transcriptional regulator with XRE-family HTH domain|nr:helix-turn-helix domain-containing protein [Paludibacter sp.]